MAISNQHRLYGELLCRFANAQTSDEAGLKYLEDLKKAFEFPDSIKSSITGEEIPQDFNKFPAINEISEAGVKIDKTPLKKILSKYQNAFADRLTYFYNRDLPFEENSKYFYFHKVPSSVIPEIVKNDLEYYLMGYKSIIRGLSKDEREKIATILCEHFYILETQEELIRCLNYYEDAKCEDANFDRLNGVIILDRFLTSYNEVAKRQAEISEEGKIKIIDYPFEASFFLNRSDTQPHYCLAEYYHQPIAFCLVEFFQEPQNQRYLKKCDFCKQFYIAKKLNPKQHYCPPCSKKNKMTPEEKAKYMEGYRANPARKKAKAKKKREALIQHYMDNAGKTRKEAEMIIETD